MIPTMVYWLSGKFALKQTAADESIISLKVLSEMEKSNIALKTPTMIYWLSGTFADIAL
jgi:delta-aminolevulinic acid dehydratase/porphobilinogen synthase